LIRLNVYFLKTDGVHYVELTHYLQQQTKNVHSEYGNILLNEHNKHD